MKKYEKPTIEEVVIEFSDVILTSITVNEGVFDLGENPTQIFE